MNFSFFRPLALCAALVLGIAGTASDAAAAKAGPAKKSRAVKVKHQQNNSQESTAERDRRLYRECKGMPNAGACRGYTQR